MSCVVGCNKESAVSDIGTEESQSKVIDYCDLEDIAISADMEYFEYDELNSYAQIIARVEVLDDLTETNSIPVYADEDKSIVVAAIAKRKIKILEYYKNDENCADAEMEVLECAAIVDNCYYHNEGYSPLEKGQTYILYMSNDTASGQYGIISDFNSVIKLEDPFEHVEYADIAFKSLVEYESDLSKKEKEKLLDKEVSLAGDSEEHEEMSELNISTDNEDVDIEYVETRKEIKIVDEN